MNISELLAKTINEDWQNVCINITTVTDIFNLCFIDYEDYEKLGIYVTGEDGRERYHIIYKEHIVALQVVYEQDIQIDEKGNDEDMMII